MFQFHMLFIGSNQTPHIHFMPILPFQYPCVKFSISSFVRILCTCQSLGLALAGEVLHHCLALDLAFMPT